MTKERSTKIVTFMTPRTGFLVLGRGQIGYIVKMHNFFKNLPLYSQAYIRLTMYKVMRTKKGSTKIVNLKIPGAWDLMLERGHISHYNEDVLYSTFSIYRTLIAIVLRDYDTAFLYHH